MTPEPTREEQYAWTEATLSAVFHEHLGHIPEDCEACRQALREAPPDIARHLPPFVTTLSSLTEPTDEIEDPLTDADRALLDEMREARDRAAVSGANYWIGGRHV